MALLGSRPAVDETLERALSVVGTRGGLTLAGAYFVTAVVCAFLPLADHIGFEFALALTIVGALFAPAAGVAAVRMEGLRIRSDRRFGLAAAGAAIFSAAMLIIPSGLMLLNALRRPSCDPVTGGQWLLVLPVPTAMLAASVGALAGVSFKSGAAKVFSIALVEAVSIGTGLSTLRSGPAFYLFDPFFGYFPGPLYDEVVLFSRTLLAFRACTLLWALAVMLACAAAGSTAGRTRNGLTAALLAGALVVTSQVYGTKLGFRTTDASLADALGGVRTIDQLEIHYPREWNEKGIDAFAHDAAFRASQVIAELHLTNPPVVRVWVYRNAEEKRQLTGAGGTSFSKPWRHEVHINAAAFPHPVIRHELVHAFGSEIAHGPWGTPGGWLPISPLIEGFAVALDVDDDGLTLAQWAKAMKEIGNAPDVSALFSSWSFLTAAPARAYQYAGAFLRFLDETQGRNKLLELYATGDLTRLGKPQELIAAFNASLDKIEVSPSDRALAERRLSRPSVFRRRCAREVGQLSEHAQALADQGRLQEAISQYEDVCAMEPDDPGALLSLMKAAIHAKNTGLRDETLAKILAHPKADAGLKTNALLEVGDDLWKSGANEPAAARFKTAGELPAEPSSHRLAFVKERVVENPELSALLKPLLAEGDSGIGEMLALNDYVRAHHDPLIEYLLGRQLVQHSALTRGIPLLESASKSTLGDGEMDAENTRLIVRTNAELGRCDAAEKAIAKFDGTAANASDRSVARDWVARCRFAAARGWKPPEEAGQ